MTDEDIGVAPVVENSANEAVQPETVEVETTQEESAASETPAPEGEEHKPSRRDRRIDALTKKNYDALRQLEAERQAREQLQAQMAQLHAQQQVPGENFPTLEQYNYDPEAYEQAVKGWHQNQVQAQEQARTQQAELAAQQQAQMQEHQRLQAAMAKGQEKYPDFVAKVTDPNLPPLREVNPVAYQAVMESDTGVDVAYYLASNPQAVYEFASMNPVQAIRKVAQIEASLAAKPMPSPVAPAPPTTLSGKADAVKDPSKMTTDEWMEWRNQQVHKR